MQTGDDRIEALTERQRECLQLFYMHLTIREIAGKLGLSVEGVNYHLQKARELLRVSSSAAAARLVFGSQPPSHYISNVGTPNAVEATAGEDIAVPVSNDGGAPVFLSELREVGQPFDFDYSARPTGMRWPFPSRGRTKNDLKWYQILAWGFGIAFLATSVVGSMMSIFRLH